MSADQTLNKLQNIIHETLPELELFVDGNIQPSSLDCENLQKHLYRLQEQLSIFKHLKANKELSPSFGIHAKISGASAAKTEIIEEEILKHEETIIVKPNSLEKEIESLKSERELKSKTSTSKKIEVSLNQKFQFINELFGQNATEYALAIDQINDCDNEQDAELYMNSLKSAYGWKDSNENFKRLKELSQKRFH